jgi:hypothetical protein
MSKPFQPMLNQFLLNWCHPNPILNIVVPDSIPLCVPTTPTQHTHLYYTQLLDMSPFFVDQHLAPYFFQSIFKSIFSKLISEGNRAQAHNLKS